MPQILIERSSKLNNIIDSPIVRMELFGLPKHLVRTLALEGKIKAVRVSNSPNAKILVNIQSLNDYFNSAVIGTVEPETKVGGIQPIPVKL